MASPRVFGNSMRSLRGTTILAVTLSLAVAIALYLFAFDDASRVARATIGGVVGASILVIIESTALATCLFALRVDELRIAHVFCGRFILATMPLVDLQSVYISEETGAIFTFRNGAKIRLFLARVDVLGELSRYLQERRMQGLEISVFVVELAKRSLTGGEVVPPDKSLEHRREE